jgi:hypothetical protein
MNTAVGTLDPLERVVAIQDIVDLQARRCLAVDTKDWPLHNTLHTPDFRSFLPDEHHWVTGGTIYTQRIAALTAGKESLHHVFAPIIEFETSGRAKAIWKMENYVWWNQEDENHWMHGFGYYHESLEKRMDFWRFTSRHLEFQKVLMSPGATLSVQAAGVAK